MPSRQQQSNNRSNNPEGHNQYTPANELVGASERSASGARGRSNNPEGHNQYTPANELVGANNASAQSELSGAAASNNQSELQQEKEELQEEIQEIREEYADSKMPLEERGRLGSDTRKLKSLEQYGDSNMTYQIGGEKAGETRHKIM